MDSTNTAPSAQAKRCSHCRVTKPRADFTRDRNSSDGRTGRCRRCNIEGQRVSAFRNKLLKSALYARSERELAERLERFRVDNAELFDRIAANPRGPYVRRSPHMLRRWGQR